MIKYIYLVLTLMLVCFVVGNVVAEETSLLPIITLNDANKEPYTTMNNDGFLDVVLIEAFRRIGYQFKKVRLPPERGLLSANEGIVDGEVNRIGGIEKIYTNLRRVPEKIRDSDFCVLSKNTDIKNHPKELGQYVVGYIKGWKIYEKMMAGSEMTITANDPQQLFRLLKINRIEVALYTCMQGFILAKENNIEGIKVLEPRLKQREMFVFLNKKHEDLLPKLSKALKNIKQEGLYDTWKKAILIPHMLPYEPHLK